jgi:DNA polymerase, archaea type
MSYDPIIFGKNNTENIVSMEIHDGAVHLFLETADGIEEVVESNKPWILAPIKLKDDMVRLQGDQYYKWGIQFQAIEEYNEFKKNNYRRDIYTIHNLKENCMVNKGYTYFKGMKIEDVSVLSFDIETNGLTKDSDSKTFLISNTYRKNNKVEKRLFALDDFNTPAEMIEAWCYWVTTKNPSIMLGHNIFGFDLPYLDHYAKLCGLPGLKLGRDDSYLTVQDKKSDFRVDGNMDLSYHRCSCYGRELIDTLFLAYRYDAASKKYNSYGLKSIIQVEKLEKEGRQFYDASKIRENWENPEERRLIKQYCIDDSDDSLALFDLMAPSTFYVTQSVPKSFQQMVESATGSQINSVLVRAYLQDRHSVAKATDLKNEEKVEGGISFAIPGVYNNVLKVDIKSCYPSQILRFKLHDKEKDPNAYYHYVVEYFTLRRFDYKKMGRETGLKYYKDLDASAKIFINSSYGVANTPGLNYNSAKIARKITSESRAIIDMALRWASGKGYIHWIERFYDAIKEKADNRVYLATPDYLKTPKQYNFTITPTDTDSISFCKVDQQEFTNEEISTLIKEINDISPEKIEWENDGYYKRVVAIRAKNYILNDGENLTIKGSALKASTKSKAMKEFTKKIINILIYTETKEEMHLKLKSLYTEYVKKASNVSDMMEWASRKTLTATVMTSTRTNETKVVDALKGSNYREGDRFYTFYLPDDSLCLVENFKGSYDANRLYENIYNTVCIFDTILPVKELFTNYTLRKNQTLLQELLNEKENT